MTTSSQQTNILENKSSLVSFTHERAERIFHAAVNRLHRGRLTINYPSGNSRRLNGSQDTIDGQKFHGVLNLKSYRALKRVLSGRAVGFAEGYMHDDWDTPDLTHLLELLACNMDAMEAAMPNWGVQKAWNRVQHLLRANSKSGSRRNIAYHYDLGNDFYAEWLDPSMTYSSALFDSEHDDLQSAQENKYRQLAEKLELKAHHRVLEIGCGWGGFAEFAAKTYGCKIVCLTLSKEQLCFAQQRINAAGLANNVELRLQDYRDVEGQFDRVVSIEMFEAVGEEYWGAYFAKVKQLLRPGGQAGLQIISIENERFDGYKNQTDFIQKYIFPGGMLPSPEKLNHHIEQAGLTKTAEHLFGPSYARTLSIWRQEFLRNWDSISKLGYSRKFRRMWEYYFCYCEAGFRRGTIDVGHYFLQHDGVNEAPGRTQEGET